MALKWLEDLQTVPKLDIGADFLIQVASKQLGSLIPGTAIPQPMYQQGGLLAETLAGTGPPPEIVEQELVGKRVLSCARKPGKSELDIALFYRDQGLAAPAGEVIADLGVAQ